MHVPKNEGRASDEERDQPPASSVFDFLYYDSRRIGSFLSQFDPNGHLQGVRRTEGVSDLSSSKSTYTGKGSVAVASVAANSETTGATTVNDAAERQYDSLWSNAVAFLDYLAGRDLLHRDLSRARISQFVLASGDLGVVDLTMMKKFWEMPAMRGLASQGVPQQEKASRRDRRAGRASNKTPEMTEQQVGFEILSIIPHSVQATVEGPQGKVWATLREEAMIVSPSDLFLKHGRYIPGRWNMLGIVDALPGDPEDTSVVEAEEMAEGLWGGLGTILDALGPIARVLLGRPTDSFGMTPLVIFREVSGE